MSLLFLFRRLGHGDLIEEEGKSVPFRVEILHMHRSVTVFSSGFVLSSKYWKVPEFESSMFQDWKVLENDRSSLKILEI